MHTGLLLLPGHSLVTECAFYLGKWRFPNPSTNPGEHQLVGLVRFKMSSPFNRYYFLMNHFIGSPCFKMFVSLRMLHTLSVMAAFLVLWQHTRDRRLGKGKGLLGHTLLRVLVTGSWPVVWGLWWGNRWWQRQEVDEEACLLPEKQRKEVLGLALWSEMPPMT